MSYQEKLEMIRSLPIIYELIKELEKEIEWKKLTSEDYGKESKKVQELREKAEKIENLSEITADELSDEYYQQKVEDLKTSLREMLAKIKEDSSWVSNNFDEKNQIRSYSRIIKNPEILNENVTAADSENIEGKEGVFAYSNGDELTGYAYDEVLSMCKELLKINPRKYIPILFNSPKIELVKPELINWLVNYFREHGVGLYREGDAPFDIEYLSTLPVYILKYLDSQIIQEYVESEWVDDEGNSKFPHDLGYQKRYRFGKAMIKTIGQTKYVSKQFLESTAELWLRFDDEYAALIANPNLSLECRKFIEDPKECGRYSNRIRDGIYYWLPRVNSIDFLDFSYYDELNTVLKDRPFAFKGPNNENLDWFFDMDAPENKDINIGKYKKASKLCALRSIICGTNLFTTKCMHEYIDIKNIDDYLKIVTGLSEYISEKSADLHPNMKIYFLNILSGFVSAAFKYGFVDKLKEFLQEMISHDYSEYVRLKLIRCLKLINKIEKYQGSTFAFTGGDALYMNDYTIEDIEKLYVQEIANKHDVGIKL